MQESKASAPTVSPEPAPNEQLSADRMIVRTGSMALVVEEVNLAVEQISAMANRFGGYVVSSTVRQERERLIGSISIRVPVEHFDIAVSELRALAVNVTGENTFSRDVTEEFVDLTARLKNLEATEEQLLRILAKAEKVEDILAVQRELSRTREEIEQTKGRMQFLEKTSDTALIDITLEQSKLSIEFNAQRTRVKEREEVVFLSDVAGGFTPYSHQWDLGDGTTSTDEVVTHTYKNDGKYTVSLTVTDDRGNTATKTRTDYITVIPGWSASNTATGAWNGVVTFSHVLTNIAIWIVVFSPFWIIVGGVVFGVYRWRHRNKV